ncbi:hypothetical protein [Streptomyces malaysiensis]|uniref:hypothetical protein n=1 Tax=Streptomyces malaysiensis TaxID=92644 RepID=UPI00340C4FF7
MCARRTEGAIIGTAAEVADGMERWYTEGACDGFTVGAVHSPGAFEDFVRQVVPELQRRGVLRTEYEGKTLRDNLGLERPASGTWRNRRYGARAPAGPGAKTLSCPSARRRWP